MNMHRQLCCRCILRFAAPGAFAFPGAGIMVKIMIPWKKTSAIIVLLVIFFFAGSPCAGKQPPSMTIRAHDSIMDIDARQVAIEDVLRAISSKMGIALKIKKPIQDKVSFQLKDVSAEEVFKKLLVTRNYIFNFRKTEDGQFVLVELQVMGSSPEELTNIKSEGPLGQNENERPLAADHPMEQLAMAPTAQPSGNTDNLTAQMTAIPLSKNSSSKGIMVLHIAEKSALSQIGLTPGDTIGDINGKAVTSDQQFLQALAVPHVGPDGTSITRIERWRNGRIDPIYIEKRK